MHPGTFAETWPDKAAVVMAGGRQLTYRELEQQSNQLAHLLRDAGLRRGDHVAFCVENRPEFFVCAWAAQRSGLYYTPCSTRLHGDELAYIVDDCGAKAFLATARTVDAAGQVPATGGRLRLLIDGDADGDTGGWVPFARALSDHPTSPIADQAEGASMLYTSGTTGRPKGVVRPLPDVTYPHLQPGLDQLFELGEDVVYLSPAPLYHAAPLAFTMMVLRLGGTLVVQERFDPEQALRLIEQYEVTFTQMVPTMFIRLLKLPAEVRARYDLSSLRAAIHASAPCPIEVKERMMDWWGPIIHEYYAGTENICFVYCDPQSWLTHKGTVGQSLLSPVHILDDRGNELPTGQTGTIYFESSGFVYHGDPEKTAQARDPLGRGWSTMGDIGHVDGDGFLYLTDRRAHTIISGGVNIYPQEAENALAMHPAVDDVAVFGIPDDEMGERVHAVVQPAAGVDPTPELAEELIEHCRQRIARFKCPRSVDFRPTLPRDEAGKLYKRLLRAEHWPRPTGTA